MINQRIIIISLLLFIFNMGLCLAQPQTPIPAPPPTTQTNVITTKPYLKQTTTTTTVTTTTSSINDDAIVTNVYNKYAKSPALIGTALKVTSKNGVVSIDGTVTAQSQADEAANLAKSVPDVQDVRSYVIVTTNPNQNKRVPTPNY